ncbi:MAG: hypothetical protein HYR66_14420 [Sphingobacteriales bacterium]|nr:hypothetical protein [Sphingobacteriales bacterium]MBI3719867.1 hypothetical protein [Sphingobacteriales bacterium]
MLKINLLIALAIIPFFTCFSQTIINYQNWSGASGCNIFASSINVPAVINGTNGAMAHVSTTGQPQYSITNNAISMDCNVVVDQNGNTTGYKGTEYKIAYNFKAMYSYQITINAACVGGATANLRILPNNSGSGTSNQCNGTSDIDPNTSGNLYANKVMTSGTTWTDYTYNYSSFATAQGYLNIAAVPPINSPTQTILVRKITITETAQPPTFTISPTSVSIPCGTNTTQSFTVNNVYNSPGTLSYNWNLGTANNGWLYQGSTAPQTFSTTTNAISLTSSATASSLSNVSVTVVLNGANYTTLTSNVTLTTPTYNFSISGNTIICNSAVYSVPGLPAGASVSWSIPGSAGTVLQLSPNNPAANQLTITNQRWYDITTTLTATITGLSCGITKTATKTIKNDNSTSAVANFPYFQEACTYYNVSHPSQSGTAVSGSTATYVHQGCTVYVNLGDMTGKTVTLASGSGTPTFWAVGSTAYYTNTLYFQLPLGSGGVPFTFQISGNGACYTQSLLFFSYSNNARVASSPIVSISPNPATDFLFVNINRDFTLQNKFTQQRRTAPLLINVYDINTNTRQIIKTVNLTGFNYKLNISALKTGYYVLVTNYNGQVQSFKFLKE